MSGRLPPRFAYDDEGYADNDTCRVHRTFNNRLVAHEQVGLCHSLAAWLHVNASSPSQRGGHMVLSNHPVVGPALLRNRVPILLESISGCDRCSALRIRYDAYRGLRET